MVRSTAIFQFLLSHRKDNLFNVQIVSARKHFPYFLQTHRLLIGGKSKSSENGTDPNNSGAKPYRLEYQIISQR